MSLIGLEYVQRLRETYVDQSLTTESRFERPQECPVCYESEEELLAMSACGHWIGRGCLMESLKHSGQLACPLCRTLSDVDDEHQCAMRVCNLIMEDERFVQTLPDRIPFFYKSMVCENTTSDTVSREVTIGVHYAAYVKKMLDEEYTEREERRLRWSVRRSKEATFGYENFARALTEDLPNIRFTVKQINKNLTFLSITCYAKW